MAADMAARSGRRHTVTTQGVQMFRLTPLSPMGGCGLVSVCALVLSAFGFLDGVRQNPTFQWSFLGAAVLLLRRRFRQLLSSSFLLQLLGNPAEDPGPDHPLFPRNTSSSPPPPRHHR